MGLQFFVCLFLFPFGAYADEMTVEEIESNSNAVAYASGTTLDNLAEMIALMQQETVNYMTALKEQITELRQTMNNNFANIYRNADGKHPASLEAIYERVGDVYTNVSAQGDRITNSLSSLKTQIQGYINSAETTLISHIDNAYQHTADMFSILYRGDETHQASLSAIYAEIQGTKDVISDEGKKDRENADANTDKVLNEGSDKPAYEFDSGLTDVLIKLDEYCTSLDDTLLQINNASNAVSEYLTIGTEMIESTLGVFPSIFIALITFGIVFVFARKVVGR